MGDNGECIPDVCDRKICSPDTLVNELASRTMNIPPSGDGCDSLTGVGVGGECEQKIVQVAGGGGDSCERKALRVDGSFGSNSGKIEVVGGGGVNKIKMQDPSAIKSESLYLPSSYSAFPRWIHDPLFPEVGSTKFSGFPRAVPLFKHLSSFTSDSTIARNGIVEGKLLPPTAHLSPLIGIITQEWCDWLPALSLVPLEPLWVWVLILVGYGYVDGCIRMLSSSMG